MRIAKYIAAFVVMLATVGCTMIDLDELSWKENTGPSSTAVSVLGHITRYDGCEVSSRADNAKKPELGETRTTCMAFAVFKMEEDAGNYTVGPLVHYEFQATSNITFILEREGAMHDDDGNGTADTEVVYEDDALYAMYVFANIHTMPATWAAAKGMTLAQMKAYAYAPKAADYNKAVGVGIPSDGFPMIGSLGDCSAGGDGHKLDLVVMDGTTMRVPTVDGVARDLLEVPLDVMYAKFRFEISLNPDQVVPGMDTPTFQMHEYTVHNISGAVTFDKASNTYDSGEVASVASFEPTVEISGEADGTQGGKVVFEFYIPEMCVTPATASTAYEYPFRGAPGGTPSASDPGIRKEDEEKRQRYKPDLLGDDQKAAYITIHGTYRDHQHHSWEVYYDIYLGSDNYSNFDVNRNTLYSNYITIGGIQNSNDHSEEDQAVSMDHRVDIKRKLPFIVGLRRECLLDAHFEVRPLRIRLDDDYGGTPPIPDNAAVQVSVSYLDNNRQDTTLPVEQMWVGLERSYGDGVYNESTESGTYIYKATDLGDPRYPSNGKRKYFTTNLINSLSGGGSFENGLSTSGGQTVTVPMPKQLDNSDEQCVWIYVDECTETSTDIEAKRYAKVVVTYGTVSGDTFTPDSYWQPVTYILCQHKLYEVTYEGRTYYIEHEEEYLYDFDSEDTFSYSPTFDEGMSWGLNGVQLSKEHRSFTNNTNNTSWTNYVNNNTLPTYDFYIAKHDGTLATIAGATMVHRSAGRHFTEDIVEKSNNGVKNLTMAEQPSGAVEYCYNRNKRNTDGSIAKVEWYLPATDELEDILNYGYGLFNGVFQNNFYWTSQPAYIRNVYYYEDGSNTFPFVVYDDNPAYARATKVNAKGGGVFEYALSGLNQATNVVDPSTGKILDFTGSGEVNAGYYYMMYRWKSGAPDTTFGQGGDFGGEVNGKQYTGEEFGEKLGGSSTGTRYHVHLTHLDDLVQEGYHHRTKSNRVRCVRKDYSDDDEQAVLVYKVSPTPATSLDKSGNTLYVMRNANYQSTSLTTSGTNLAASNSAVGMNNLVIVKGNKVIKSVAKGLYFNGADSSVSFSNSATNYTITANGQGYTISATTGILIWQTTYYLKQTNNTTVQMQTGNSGDHTWYFYEVEIE